MKFRTSVDIFICDRTRVDNRTRVAGLPFKPWTFRSAPTTDK
jgi:hypothetical protein